MERPHFKLAANWDCTVRVAGPMTCSTANAAIHETTITHIPPNQISLTLVCEGSIDIAVVPAVLVFPERHHTV